MIYRIFLKEICSLKMSIVYYLWCTAFIGSYYFGYIKKTIEQIYQNMRLLICKLIVMTYLSDQNYILFYNKCLKRGKNLILCCCLATKDAQSNYFYVIVVFAFMGQMCTQTTSPTTNKTYLINILHIYLPLPPAKIVKNVIFRGHGLP